MLEVNLGEAFSGREGTFFLGALPAACLSLGLRLGGPCPRRIIAFGVPWLRGRDNPLQDFSAPRSGRSRSGPGSAGLLQPSPSIRLNS